MFPLWTATKGTQLAGVGAVYEVRGRRKFFQFFLLLLSSWPELGR